MKVIIAWDAILKTVNGKEVNLVVNELNAYTSIKLWQLMTRKHQVINVLDVRISEWMKSAQYNTLFKIGGHIFILTVTTGSRMKTMFLNMDGLCWMRRDI